MVVDIKRTVKRTYPRFLAWSTKELNKRQERELKCGFGLGYIDEEGEILTEAKVII